MTVSAAEAALTLPARSTALAVRVWPPVAKALGGVKLQVPAPVATVEPNRVAPS